MVALNMNLAIIELFVMLMMALAQAWAQYFSYHEGMGFFYCISQRLGSRVLAWATIPSILLHVFQFYCVLLLVAHCNTSIFPSPWGGWVHCGERAACKLLRALPSFVLCPSFLFYPQRSWWVEAIGRLTIFPVKEIGWSLEGNAFLRKETIATSFAHHL